MTVDHVREGWGQRDFELPDFSLVLGGPLYQLLLRAGMIRPSMDLLRRRVIAAVVITWLPLAALTAAGGGFLAGVNVPFLYDLDVHVRFLLALPLLIAAEVIVHRRVHAVVEQFEERNLVAPADRRAFEAIVSATLRLRNSVAIELLLLVLSFTAGYWLWRSQASLHVATWYGSSANDALSFTWAGYWYVFVSIPIFRFIILRWYFRLLVWYLFLLRVSRLRLELNPLHPDRAGGLGFLSLSTDAIAPVLIAQTVFLSGLIANQIWHEGATLPQFKLLIAGVLGFLMLIALVPRVLRAPDGGGQTGGTPRVRFAGRAICQRLSREMGARAASARRAARQRGLPIARRSREQLRRGPRDGIAAVRQERRGAAAGLAGAAARAPGADHVPLRGAGAAVDQARSIDAGGRSRGDRCDCRDGWRSASGGSRDGTMSDAAGDQLVTTGYDAEGNPFILWQQPDGRFCRASIERPRGEAGPRFLLVASTQTLGGEMIGTPARSRIFHDADDWDILRGYVKDAISPPPG